MAANALGEPAAPPFTAVVAGAGEGTRMGAPRRKPFLLLDGVPIVVHCLSRLSLARGCRGIVAAVPPDSLERCRRLWGRRLMDEFHVTAIVPGGPTRQASVLAALETTSPEIPLVLIHDAARPLARVELIEAVAARAAACGAAIAAVPAAATVKEVGADGVILHTPARERLWLAQTPQGFRRELVLQAHCQAQREGFQGTDDSLLVERLGHKVMVVEDSPENIKITTPADMAVAEAILRWQQEAGFRGVHVPTRDWPEL